MYGASDSVAGGLPQIEGQTRKQKYSTFLALIGRVTDLSFWEMHNLAALIPDWMHHLSYQEIERALASFTHGRFIPFLQKSYKEAFGEVCRQAYLHGCLYHLLEDVSIDNESFDLIKKEVKAEVLQTHKKRYFAKLFGVQSELNVHLDREPKAKNTEVVDAIVADAVVEAACKKMSHSEDELARHEEVHKLAKRAIMECLSRTACQKELRVAIPCAKGHVRTSKGDAHFVYDMASFILSNN